MPETYEASAGDRCGGSEQAMAMEMERLGQDEGL
jgi:hypothetical protein